jgi:hypothetical protein
VKYVDNELERLARLETRLDSLESHILRMDAKLDIWNTQYPTRIEIEEKFKNRDDNLKAVWYEIDEIKENNKSNKTTFPMWTAIILSAIGLIVNIIMVYK